MLREARPLFREAGLQLSVNGFFDCEPLYVLRDGVDNKELHIGQINLRERLAVLLREDCVLSLLLAASSPHGAAGAVALKDEERVEQP